MSTHPARFSPSIVTKVREIALERWPDFWGRPTLFDPYGGDGEGLAEIAGTEFNYAGLEIEPAFIINPRIVEGDATDPTMYPAGPHAIVTSPAYGSNGISDSWKMSDESKRRTYRRSLELITGNRDYEMHPNNMGALGYRGTKRPEEGGKSQKRAAYWAIAAASVKNWDRAELVILNVSDSIHGTTVEPHIEDWTKLMLDNGWQLEEAHPVPTQRFRMGANREKRIEYEMVLVFSRA